MTRVGSDAAERRSLRRTMRDRRRALAPEQRRDAEAAIVRAIGSLAAYARARAIGTFAAFDGEPSLDALVRAARGTGKRFYLPVLRGDTMRFARLATEAKMRRNSFGILEPETLEPIDARRLDVVLTPLVACDGRGTRLGVGGGYYDRCFAFLARRSFWRRPKLVGAAYSFQRIEHIERMPWDVPLWALATEHGVERFCEPA